MEKPRPSLKDIKRFATSMALAVPMLLPGIGRAQEYHSDPEIQQTAAGNVGEPAELTETVAAAPEATPSSSYQEPLLFAFNARKPIKIKDEVALEKYLSPFNSVKIGETTDAELAKTLKGVASNITVKGSYIVYEIPIPATTSQELARRYYGKRSNEIITENGVVVAERVVGIAPEGLERVPNMDYVGLTGQMPETTNGHLVYGNTINNFYPEKGLVTITSSAPAGPDADMINEYIVYDPRKPDGTYMTADEFKKKYAEIHGKQEFDYNPNVAATP